jgi:hypothetical protein
MKLSQGDRSALIARVEQRLDGRVVNRAAIHAAVDQVLARLALPDESPAMADGVFALTAESMPDLASRVRQRLSVGEAASLECATATSGRFTVVAMRTSGVPASRLEAVAHEVGARFERMGDARSVSV